MRGWLTSPLFGTAGVITALGLISIPLHRLTSTPPVRNVPLQEAAATGERIPAVLRLRLLAPAERLSLETGEGSKLIELRDLEAGVSEHDLSLSLAGEKTNLRLGAGFGGNSDETAVFVTLMPDGFDEQTRYSIGKGSFEEMLQFDWSKKN